MFEFWLIVDLIVIIGHSILLATLAAPAIDRAKGKYFEKIKKDLKQNAISEEKINQAKGFSSGLQKRYWTSVGIGVILFFPLGIFLSSLFDGADNSCFIANCILLGITQITGVYLWTSIDDIVEKEYETMRCPHCNAPISYFLIDKYNSDEFYFKKRVKRTKNSGTHSYTYYEDVPMVKYTENRVFQCDVCRSKDVKKYDRQVESKNYR